MKVRRFSPLVIWLVVAGCEPQADEEGMAENAASEVAATSGDEAAIDELRAAYAQHFNLHHAPVVAEMYGDSAVALLADGAVLEGKAAIATWLEESMAVTPALELTSNEMRVFGDHAVDIGSYTLQTTPPGGTAASSGGSYLSVLERGPDGWKLSAVITNFNAPPPEGFAYSTMAVEPPPDEGTMKALTDAWAQHFNLGHASVVAGYYEEDAKAAFGDRPLVTGKPAVEAALTERAAAGSPQIVIHDVYTLDLGEGYAVDAGWFERTATVEGQPANSGGTYMTLVHQQADGTWKIQWHVSNIQPAT
ncbi:MAG: YybH family protein [Longimicrobiales bacterium]